MSSTSTEHGAADATETPDTPDAKTADTPHTGTPRSGKSRPPIPPAERDLTAPARIRDAAIDVFARQGFTATVRAIAQQAGVSPGLVIHHFGSKHQLVVACDEHVRAVVRGAKDDVLGPGGPTAMLEMLAGLEGYRTVTMYLVRSLSQGGDLARQLVDGMTADTVEYLREGVAAGTINPTRDEHARARALILQALGGVVLYMTVLSDAFPEDTEAAFTDYMNLMSEPLLELYTSPLLRSTDLLDAYRARRTDS